jgi:hypothetical protein
MEYDSVDVLEEGGRKPSALRKTSHREISLLICLLEKPFKSDHTFSGSAGTL